MSSQVVIKKRQITEINALPSKTRRMISEILAKLEENSLPGIQGKKKG